jgi:hypothetical protein
MSRFTHEERDQIRDAARLIKAKQDEAKRITEERSRLAG